MSTHRPTQLRQRRNRIIFFFFRVLASGFWWDVLIRNLGGRRWANRTALKRYVNHARRFRALAIDLGGVMIKLGQFFASRVDILPKEIIDELSSLQDEVPAEAFDDIRAALERELNRPIGEIFSTINPVPTAAASLGQVHHVVLKSGERAIVKVQRPGIEALVAVDLQALRTAAGWVKRYGPIRRRVDVDALADEFSRTLYQELDYLAEGRNIERFATDFKDWEAIRIPHLHWEFTTRRVLVMEDIGAIKVSDVRAYQAQGVLASEVALALYDFYLQQVFVNGFFHADPHPGNMFVEPLQDGDFTLNIVDFGMVGTLSTQTRTQLREMFLGIATRAAPRVGRAIDHAGWLLPWANRGEIERAATKVFARYWGISMSDIQNLDVNEMRGFLSEFRSLIYQAPFQIPADLLFLGRALGILSGLAMQIDVNFNVFEAAAPFAQKLLADESGNLRQEVLQQVVDTGLALVRMPRQFDRMADLLASGDLRVTINEQDRLLHELTRLNQSAARIPWAILAMGLFLGAVLLLAIGQTAFSLIAFGLALICGLWLLFRG
ncbi:MAG: AarF/ABC1/UbiB kinase family protein [Chloroflexi bacterium]|nr:AarF/ABC1/UbiB kinase family protein [Chloroflexota bacterium]